MRAEDELLLGEVLPGRLRPLLEGVGGGRPAAGARGADARVRDRKGLPPLDEEAELAAEAAGGAADRATVVVDRVKETEVEDFVSVGGDGSTDGGKAAKEASQPEAAAGLWLWLLGPKHVDFLI